MSRITGKPYEWCAFNHDTGEEETIELATTKEVCDRCEGIGKIFNPAIANHAYTREEFLQEYPEEEDQIEYFAGANGIYGVICPKCNGDKIVDEVDIHKLKENPDLYSRYLKQLKSEAEFRRMQEDELASGA